MTRRLSDLIALTAAVVAVFGLLIIKDHLVVGILCLGAAFVLITEKGATG